MKMGLWNRFKNWVSDLIRDEQVSIDEAIENARKRINETNHHIEEAKQSLVEWESQWKKQLDPETEARLKDILGL